jgi:hypothetical protein
LQRIRAIEGVGSVRTSIRLIEQSHCRPIEPVAALLRTNRTSESRLTIRPARPMISETQPLDLEGQAPTASVFLTIDLYELDGTVRHLAAGASRPVNVNGRKLQLGERGEWPITGPPGQRLVVAIASAKPLDLGQRKASEPAAEYLAALRSALARAASAQPDPLIADVTLFETRAAAKPVQASDRRRETPSTTPAEPQSQPCGNILERAQLGETLSDADRAVLQSRCK